MASNLFTLLFLAFIWIAPSFSFGQNTVGLLSYNPESAFEGYNLIYPHNQPHVYLLNNCGEIVHTWEDSSIFRPGNSAYILENGNLVKTKRHFFSNTDPIWFGGGGAYVEIRDWDNQLLWSFMQNDTTRRLHHDIAPMPNGHILMISWELKRRPEIIMAGRNPALLAQDSLLPDYILEVDPNTDSVVWEWHAWDHLIQDFSASSDNYGVVKDHPELIDINWDRNNGIPDWLHINAIDYNPILDQIILSVPFFDEVWIIDHSTTSEEAASHTGGNSGKGGDLIYRWGNPAAYARGTEEDKLLHFQHDIHWVDDFVERSNRYFGKLAVFNNLAGEDFSTINVFTPSFDSLSWSYPLSDDMTWGPTAFDLTLTHPVPQKAYSPSVSSVQILPNNNILICSGRTGYGFELTPENEVVWEYVVPLMFGKPISQGDNLMSNSNLTFRMNRYPITYQGFHDKDLSPRGYIEVNPDTTFCDRSTPTFEVVFSSVKIFPNPASDFLFIEQISPMETLMELYNVLGEKVLTISSKEHLVELSLQSLPRGLYMLKIGKNLSRKVLVN